MTLIQAEVPQIDKEILGRLTNIKLIIIALLFLVYLYGRSSALMIYWTFNNILSGLIIVFGFINKRDNS